MSTPFPILSDVHIARRSRYCALPFIKVSPPARMTVGRPYFAIRRTAVKLRPNVTAPFGAAVVKTIELVTGEPRGKRLRVAAEARPFEPDAVSTAEGRNNGGPFHPFSLRVERSFFSGRRNAARKSGEQL